ncbi:MAG: serine/threonine protein kinase [Pyrinomonadaceae bacterium]|nr:serine/threonine protein kinase [Pyrinomonadaceae bacterium]
MMTDGKKLDNRYVVLEEIGSGGFGAVYLAEDVRFTGNNRVAIKKIQQGSEQTAKAFRHEANLLYNLTHPNLPKVTNCFQEGEANYIVMDFVAGEDLMQQLKKGKRFSVAEVLAIADKVLDALEYLHSFSIFHRDIKPHNIKNDAQGKIFLLDFGTAKGQVDDATLALNEQQSITGYTPSYAPLEQVLRVDANSYLLLKSIDSPHLDSFEQHKTDARSDIYSLGATIYHLLTNTSPDRATATLRAHLLWSNKPDPLTDCRHYNSEISERLAAIIGKAVEIDPNRRFQTAAEFRTALATLSSADATAEDSPSPIKTQPNEANTAQNQNLLTQRSVEPFKIEIPLNVPPLDSIQTLVGKDAPPKRKGRFAPLLIAALVLLAFVAGFGGWLAWRDYRREPEKPNNQALNAPPNPAQTQVLSYSLLVQKMRGGAKFQEPFESSGQEIFENGYQFQIRLTPPADGFLYVFAEGLNAEGEPVLRINFPTPQRNDGRAEVTANRQYESGWNEFKGKSGTENYWLVFSREKPAVAENARADAFQNAGAVVSEDLKNKLREYLETAAKNKTVVSKDAAKKLTKVDFEGDALVFLIQLEHR